MRDGDDERAASAVGTSTSDAREERGRPGGLSMEVSREPGRVTFGGAGGSRVVDFVAAWDAISPRLAASGREEVNEEMLLSALTLAIPRLQQIPRDGERRKPAHERAVDVTLTLADLGMDAECISAGLLREAVIHGTVSLDEIEDVLGERVMRLAHDVGRVHDVPSRVRSYDENAAERLRSYYLSFHDIRAVVVELAYNLDALRNADELEPIQRMTLALRTMQIYAPMAHALNTGSLCAESEDLAFKTLFPTSYASLEEWLTAKSPDDAVILDKTVKILNDKLNSDVTLNALMGRGGVKVLARRKSRYSTMKKIIRDGRKREEVHDLLGMRLILTPQPGSGAEPPGVGQVFSDATYEEMEARALKAANAACYRAQQIVHTMFPTVSGRTKDYISNPKPNGYSSLHSTIKVAFDKVGEPLEATLSMKRGTSVEIQIRTAAMHLAAEAGKASHTSYKGGLKEDTGTAAALAELADAANDAAEEKFGAFTQADLRQRGGNHDRLFDAFDLNGDGRVTITELRTVLETIWEDEENADLREEAQALMTILDVDHDGTIDADEFARFRSSLTAIAALPKADAETLAAINAVALVSVDEEQVIDEADSVIDVDATEVPTGDSIDENAELITTVRAAITSSYEYTGKVDLAGRKAAAAMSDPEGGLVEWQLVWDLIRTGRAETARQLFYQRTTRAPGQIVVWEQWARFELLQGDPERARSLYRAALLHCEDQPLVRAEILRKWGMMEMASSDQSRSAAHEDLFSRSVNLLVEASAGGKVAAAQAIVAQAKTYQVWAQGLARMGEIEASRKLLAKASALDEDNAAVIHALGQIEETLGDARAAAATYARGLSANPTDAHLLQSLARLEAQSGDLYKARQLYERGIEANPENHYLRHAWAVSETRHPDGDASVAREQFQIASSLAAWSVKTWAAWARFEARAQDNAKAIETARTLYERGLDAEPGNVVCLLGLAECERRLGRYAAARKILERTELMHPKNWGVQYERGKLEERAGAPAQASYHYNRARELKRADRRAQPRPSTRHRGSSATWNPIDALEREELASASVYPAARVAADDAPRAADDDADVHRRVSYAPRRRVVRARRARRTDE